MIKMRKGTKQPIRDRGGFPDFLEDLEKDLFNTTGPLFDKEKDFYDYDKPRVVYPTPEDPYEEREDLPADMEDYWDKMVDSSTPAFDDDYREALQTTYYAWVNASGKQDYSGYVPPSWIHYLPVSNDSAIESYEDVPYGTSGYHIAHAIYMGAIVLILITNLVMFMAVLFQPRIRDRASTILILNFFFVEILLSIVDLVFTQKLLNVDELPNMGYTMCMAGPWMLHITQAAQPVALFVITMEAVTMILAPESYDVRVASRVAALLVLVTWLFGVALASIFVTKAELIESFIVIRNCYKNLGEPSIKMHFMMGMLQLGGPLVVLLAACITLIAVAVRKTRSQHLPPESRVRVRANVIVLLAICATYVIVTLPVLIINARFIYSTVPHILRAWVTVQLVRRLGSLFYPAFWWSRSDIRHSIKHLPARLCCRGQPAPQPRLAIVTDQESTDLLPLELSEVQPDGADSNYRAV